MTQSHYSLKWDNHQNYIMAAFGELLETESLVDVTLMCSEITIRAHKIVLSACSPFFEKLLSEVPCDHPVIVLRDFTGWEIQTMIDFMYKGEIHVCKDQIQNVMKIAENFQIRGLVNHHHQQQQQQQQRGEQQQQQQQQRPSSRDHNIIGFDKDPSTILNNHNHHHHNQHQQHQLHHSTPSNSPNHFDKQQFFFTNGNKFHMDFINARIPPLERNTSPLFSLMENYEPPIKLPHMPRLAFPDSMMPRFDCQSPIQRRKQLKPRRRSGEMSGPQDLSTTKSLSPPVVPDDETAENLCIKKKKTDKDIIKEEEQKSCTPPPPSALPPLPLPPPPSQPPSSSSLSLPQTTSSSIRSPELDFSSVSSSSGREFLTSPPVASYNLPNQQQQHSPAPLNMKQEILESSSQSHHHSPQHQQRSPISSPSIPLSSSAPPSSGQQQQQPPPPPPPTSIGFPPMPTLSALAMTNSHNKFFGLESPLGLFSAGLENCRNSLFDIAADHRNPVDPGIYIKKKRRPKGQHSAPRGGPPRSWTNSELTQALENVWNKKMTTSQASRIYGIPYNSLLMYVRGKYGKSLKLEQLRKNCIGSPNPSTVDILGALGASNNNNSNNNNNNNHNNNNNNLSKIEREPESIQPNTRPSSRDQDQHAHIPPAPLFSPFAHGFYPDFTAGFPINVNMIHLLPQSEKCRMSDQGLYGHTMAHDLDDTLVPPPALPPLPPTSTTSRTTPTPPTKPGFIKDLIDDVVEQQQHSPQDLFRPQSMVLDIKHELIQQNGQD